MINMYFNVEKKMESLKEIRENLYKHEFETIDGNMSSVVALRYQDEMDIDPSIPGYIVTKEGIVLPVVPGDVHPKVANNYFRKYYDSKWAEIKSSGKSYFELIMDNKAIMYYGPRLIDDDIIDNREVMVLTKYPPFLLSDEQMNFLSCLEKAIQMKNYKLTYHGPGQTIYNNLLSEQGLEQSRGMRK